MAMSIVRRKKVCWVDWVIRNVCSTKKNTKRGMQIWNEWSFFVWGANMGYNCTLLSSSHHKQMYGKWWLTSGFSSPIFPSLSNIYGNVASWRNASEALMMSWTRKTRTRHPFLDKMKSKRSSVTATTECISNDLHLEYPLAFSAEPAPDAFEDSADCADIAAIWTPNGIRRNK